MARSAGSPESSASAPPLSSASSSVAAPPARSPPSRTGADPPPALEPVALERLAALVGEQPEATLEQLRQRGGFPWSLKTLWFALDRLGLTQEEELARHPARPARCAEEPPRVPAGGGPDRAERAGFRRRDGGHYSDDAGLRPGPGAAGAGVVGE